MQLENGERHSVDDRVPMEHDHIKHSVAYLRLQVGTSEKRMEPRSNESVHWNAKLSLLFAAKLEREAEICGSL